MGGLCDVWVMVFSSVVEWEGLDEEGDLGEKKMGFGVSWIHPVSEIQKMGEWGIQTACRE